MHFMRFPKRSGGWRQICIPHRSLKRCLKRLNRKLQPMMTALCEPWCVHGFMPGRNVATNAMMHTGYRFTVRFDLADFFHSVQLAMLAHLPNDVHSLVPKCFIRGRAWQGLPTSPSIANLAAVSLDRAILGYLERLADLASYTRYADDLAISCNDRSTVRRLLREIPKLVATAGFHVNKRKTRVLDAQRGRRIICGIAIGDKDIHPTRRSKRRLRAAIHQGNASAITGLTQWVNAKPTDSFLALLDSLRSAADAQTNQKLQCELDLRF